MGDSFFQLLYGELVVGGSISYIFLGSQLGDEVFFFVDMWCLFLLLRFY